MLGKANGAFFETVLDEKRYCMENPGGEKRRLRSDDLRSVLLLLLERYGELATTEAEAVYEVTAQVSRRDVLKRLGIPEQLVAGRQGYDAEQTAYAAGLIADAARALRERRQAVVNAVYPPAAPLS
jgi:hypothetical protein